MIFFSLKLGKWIDLYLSRYPELELDFQSWIKRPKWVRKNILEKGRKFSQILILKNQTLYFQSWTFRKKFENPDKVGQIQFTNFYFLLEWRKIVIVISSLEFHAIWRCKTIFFLSFLLWHIDFTNFFLYVFFFLLYFSWEINLKWWKFKW